jgi:hypothetical protein
VNIHAHGQMNETGEMREQSEMRVLPALSELCNLWGGIRGTIFEIL